MKKLMEKKSQDLFESSNIALEDFHFYVSTVLKEKNEMNFDGFHEEFEVNLLNYETMAVKLFCLGIEKD
jgi:hypothetical protein